MTALLETRKRMKRPMATFLRASGRMALFFHFAATASAQPAAGEAEIASGSPGKELSVILTSGLATGETRFQVSDPFEYFIELRVEGEGAAITPETIPELRLSENLTVRDVAQGIRGETEDGGVTQVLWFRYTLVGTHPGPARIHQADVAFRFHPEALRQKLMARAVSLEITAGGNRTFWVVLAAICLIGMGGVAAWLQRSRAVSRRRDGIPVPAFQVWLQQLDRLRAKRLEGDLRGYTGGLRQVLKAAVAKRVCGDENAPAGELQDRLEGGALTEACTHEYSQLVHEFETLQYSAEDPTGPELDRISLRVRDLVTEVWKA